LFRVTGAPLHFAFHLLGSALDLLAGATGDFSYFALNFTRDVFGGALDLIAIHLPILGKRANTRQVIKPRLGGNC